MKVRARFGPLPRDLNVQLGEDGFDITQALLRIAVVQGLTAEEQRSGRTGGPGDFLPRVELELSIPYVELEGDDVAVEVWIPEPTRAALIRLGWLDPERASEMAQRVLRIVDAAYALCLAEQDADEEAAHEELESAVAAHQRYAQQLGESA
jgi:hypothetical protein